MAELDWFVRRRIEGMFRGADRDRAIELISRYKGDSPGGAKRVHLAILKLCDRDIDSLARVVDRALTDYRDVLYGAEYHSKSRKGG